MGEVERVKDLMNRGEFGNLINTTTIDMVNGVMEFDGISDYVEFDTNITDFTIDQSFTVEGWINHIGVDRFIVGNYNSTPKGWHMRIPSNNKLRFIVVQEGNIYSFSDSSVLSSGWNHVVGSWDGTQCRTYVNGVEETNIASFGSLTTINGGAPLVVGYDVESSRWPFSGEISNVKVHNKELTPTEVKKNYDELKYRFR